MELPDYHVHPDYSIDASGSIREFALAAAARRIPEIAFTTHLDLDPVRAQEDRWIHDRGVKRSYRNLEWLECYWQDIVAAQVETIGQVRLKGGLEVDFFPGFEEYVRPALAAFPWDFILISVHCLDHLAVAGKTEGEQYLALHTPEETAAAYGDALRQSIASGVGNALAHLDYLKRQITPGFRSRFMTALFPQLPEILRSLKDAGLSLEINTRAIRTYGLGEPFPGADILHLAAGIGIDRITLGSDSHSPDELGNCFEEAREFALEAGFFFVTTFQGGSRESQIPL
jgi:histidinol-phosphatase (PHP family)